MFLIRVFFIFAMYLAQCVYVGTSVASSLFEDNTEVNRRIGKFYRFISSSSKNNNVATSSMNIPFLYKKLSNTRSLFMSCTILTGLAIYYLRQDDYLLKKDSVVLFNKQFFSFLNNNEEKKKKMRDYKSKLQDLDLQENEQEEIINYCLKSDFDIKLINLVLDYLKKEKKDHGKNFKPIELLEMKGKDGIIQWSFEELREEQRHTLFLSLCKPTNEEMKEAIMGLDSDGWSNAQKEYNSEPGKYSEVLACYLYPLRQNGWLLGKEIPHSDLKLHVENWMKKDGWKKQYIIEKKLYDGPNYVQMIGSELHVKLPTQPPIIINLLAPAAVTASLAAVYGIVILKNQEISSAAALGVINAIYTNIMGLFAGSRGES